MPEPLAEPFRLALAQINPTVGDLPGNRDKIVIFTKVGADLGEPGEKGLSGRWISQAIEASLKRLGVQRIDLYFSHWPDADIPYDETLRAYEHLL